MYETTGARLAEMTAERFASTTWVRTMLDWFDSAVGSAMSSLILPASETVFAQRRHQCKGASSSICNVIVEAVAPL